MSIRNARLGQRPRQRLAGKVRMAPRLRDRADVGKLTDLVGVQKREEVVERARRVPDRIDRHVAVIFAFTEAGKTSPRLPGPARNTPSLSAAERYRRSRARGSATEGGRFVPAGSRARASSPPWEGWSATPPAASPPARSA